MNANGGPQGPMGQQNMEFNNDMLNQQRLNGNAAGPSQGNHALQDYRKPSHFQHNAICTNSAKEMQLMLLEQQNKKRLLMARQEQDNINHVPPQGSAPGGQIAFAPAMSPSGSRAGPSPNPNDQMKRGVAGTPKMGEGVMPGSPMPGMQQNRGSPAPGFEGNVPQGVRPQFFNGGIAGNPAMMNQGPSSHPQFNMQMANMNPAAMEQMRMQNGGRMPNGAPWPGQPPQQMMQPGQQPQPVGTPQQRNTTMPPPPAPSQETQGRTQPSSPAGPAAPPTPSQAPKNAPKGKKEGAAPKKVCVFDEHERTLANNVTEGTSEKEYRCGYTSCRQRCATYSDAVNANYSHACSIIQQRGKWTSYQRPADTSSICSDPSITTSANGCFGATFWRSWTRRKFNIHSRL
jgi:hypothetical protein